MQLLPLLGFVELIVGRPQKLENLRVSIVTDGGEKEDLGVYWCMLPNRDRAPTKRRPHPMDILIKGALNPEYFSRVLESWFERDSEWREARFRFSNSFKQLNFYSVDRLVSAANMFDLLPKSAVGSVGGISAELVGARDQCRRIFKQLQQSPDRDAVLGALGRIGGHNLKTKIKNRAKPIVATIGHKFPELDFVIDHAVNCRNLYVHGSESEKLYGQDSPFLSFFTDTLEFIFAVSDLLDSGWDIKEWMSDGTTLSHPFARYVDGYGYDYHEFKKSLETT